MPAEFAMPTESDLVAELNSSLLTQDGRRVDMRAMTVAERQRTEALLDRIKDLRRTEPLRGAADTIRVQKIGLVASLSVSAKAL
jgi:hypothetical protein